MRQADQRSRAGFARRLIVDRRRFDPRGDDIELTEPSLIAGGSEQVTHAPHHRDQEGLRATLDQERIRRAKKSRVVRALTSMEEPRPGVSMKRNP